MAMTKAQNEHQSARNRPKGNPALNLAKSNKSTAEEDLLRRCLDSSAPGATQAALTSPALPGAQRQNLAEGINRVAGNHYLQRVIANGDNHANGSANKPHLSSLSTPTIQRVAPAAAAGLWGIAGLEAVEAATLGLTALPIVQTAVNPSNKLVYTADKVSRLMGKEPKPFNRKHTHFVFYANSGRPGAARALFEVVVDANDYGEMVAYVRKNLQHTTSFSKSSLNVSFKSLGLFPRMGGEKDPRAWPLRFSYEGSYDPVGNGEWDFQGEFLFNAFGMFKVIEHKVVSRSFADIFIGGPPDQYVKKYPDKPTYTIPALPAAQRAILMKNYKNDPNYKGPK